MHAVVEWLDEDPLQVSVVPRSWLTNVGDTIQCYWPPQNIAKKLKRKDFETHHLPVPDENWSTHRIRCLRVEDDYTIALRKCDEAKWTSDLSAAENDERQTRHNRCRVQLSETEEASVSELTSRKRHVGRRDIGSALAVPAPCIPVPPVPVGLLQACHNIQSATATSVPRTPTQHVSDGLPSKKTTEVVAAPVSLSVLNTTELDILVLTPTTDTQRSQAPVASPAFQTPLRPLPQVTGYRTHSDQVHNDHSAGAERGLQELYLKTIEIKEQVLFNTQLLQEIVRRQRGNEREKRCRLPEHCKLPLSSYKEVLEVEQQLKSKDFYDSLVSYLSVVGGVTIKDFISRTMNTLLDPELAKQFVWAGRLTEKHAFMKLELRSVMFEATRKNPLTSKASMAEVEDELKTWLRGAEDRHGGRAERAKKSKRGRAANNQATERRSFSQERSIDGHGSSHCTSKRSQRGVCSSHTSRRTSRSRSDSSQHRSNGLRVAVANNSSRFHHHAHSSQRRSNNRHRGQNNRNLSHSRSDSQHRSNSPQASVANNSSKFHHQAYSSRRRSNSRQSGQKNRNLSQSRSDSQHMSNSPQASVADNSGRLNHRSDSSRSRSNNRSHQMDIS